MDSMVNDFLINDDIVKPLMLSKLTSSGEELINILDKQIVQINETEKTDSMSKIIEAICSGDTVLFADGAPQVLLLNTREFPTRQLEEPTNEKTLSGPRKALTDLFRLIYLFYAAG